MIDEIEFAKVALKKFDQSESIQKYLKTNYEDLMIFIK